MSRTKKRQKPAPVIVTPPEDPQCKAIASRGGRCKLDAGPDGFCVFHRPRP